MNEKYNNIRLTTEKGIANLIFNRPDQLNAMNRQMMDEIIDCIVTINRNEDIKMAIIKGEGRAFMAGADIKEYGNQTREEFKSFQERGKELYDSIWNSSKPWIAAVNGYALGGGFEIALACDLIIASETSVMGLPEVFLSLIPGGGGTQRLIQKIGINRVKEMLFTGNKYSARTLMDWGIVNAIVEFDSFDTEVMKYAEKLARRPSNSLAQLKRLANLSLTEISFSQRIEDEGQTVFKLFYEEDAQLAIRDFITKNKTE